MNTYTAGLNALEYFFNHSRRIYGDQFPLSWDDFISEVKERGDIVKELGDFIVFNQVSSYDVNQSMLYLAKRTGGGIPADSEAFVNCVSGKAMDFEVEKPWQVAFDASQYEMALVDPNQDLPMSPNMGGVQETLMVPVSFFRKNHKWLVPLLITGGAIYMVKEKTLIPMKAANYIKKKLKL